MFGKAFVIAGALGVTLAAAVSASATGAAVADPRPAVVPGGMVAGVPAQAAFEALPESAAAPSCAAIEYPGSAGKISVQTSPSGYVAWGIYMYDPSKNDGPWIVDVYVDSRRVDHKEQNYAPHGSVHPNDARRGATFDIKAVHTDLQGNVYYSVPNACTIP